MLTGIEFVLDNEWDVRTQKRLSADCYKSGGWWRAGLVSDTLIAGLAGFQAFASWSTFSLGYSVPRWQSAVCERLLCTASADLVCTNTPDDPDVACSGLKTFWSRPRSRHMN